MRVLVEQSLPDPSGGELVNLVRVSGGRPDCWPEDRSRRTGPAARMGGVGDGITEFTSGLCEKPVYFSEQTIEPAVFAKVAFPPDRLGSKPVSDTALTTGQYQFPTGHLHPFGGHSRRVLPVPGAHIGSYQQPIRSPTGPVTAQHVQRRPSAGNPCPGSNPADPTSTPGGFDDFAAHNRRVQKEHGGEICGAGHIVVPGGSLMPGDFFFVKDINVK